MFRRFLLLSTIVSTVLVTPARAELRLIVRAPGGMPVVQTLCNLIGCTSIQGLLDPNSQLFGITTPGRAVPTLLAQLLGIVNVEVDTVVSIVPPLQTIASAPSGLLDQAPVTFGSSAVWNGYASQPAAGIVRASDARNTFGIQGAGIVAVIDTGIDPNHPALAPVIVPGYDFVHNTPGSASETADISQSSVAILDGGPTRVNGSTIAVVDPTLAAAVQGLAGFGHGTIVSGIIHLVAPQAAIMPLKAFNAQGQGNLSDILRAIYFAAQSGARVINMSFSMPASSSELQTAATYATGRNMICVAAAGNDGQRILVYPAALNGVMSVASTDLQDQRSTFSNFGAPPVWIAAPGENIISTYPFSTYAAASGTSFSAPFVSGAVALLLQRQWTAGQSVISQELAHAKPLTSDLGHGRLDIVSAAGSQ